MEDEAVKTTLSGEVTREDIEVGVAGQCQQCPLAISIERAGRAAGIPGGMSPAFEAVRGYVHVGLTSVRVGRLSCLTPDNFIEFIHTFDSPIPEYKAKAQPFPWTLELEPTA